MREAADRRAAAVVRQLVARHAEADGDVVVRARLHAVEAEGAIEVAGLQRLEERKLAAALRDVRRRGVRARPLMQSTVLQPWHTPSSRTPISSGDSVDAMKLNWPTGQTNLQNDAPVNVRSTSSATPK